MAQTAQTPQQTAIADLLAEAKLSLDTALQRAQAGEPLGNLSAATLARLAAAGNSSCTNNTGCGRPGAAQ
jgi:hypothetical protein